MAKLKVPQLREELGSLGLDTGGNRAVLTQRLLAQPGESSAAHLHPYHRLPPCVTETTKRDNDSARAPPPPALPHYLTTSLPRCTVVHTLHFKCRNDIGEVEDVSVELSTQDDFREFVFHAALFASCKITRRRVDRILTLSKALAVAADPTVYLTQQQPFDVTLRQVTNLEDNRRNTAHGLKQECNRAAANSGTLRKLLGTLKLVNDGHSVKFSKKNKNLKFDDVMEVDGILLNTKVVVMNEVKNSPSLKNVAKCANRGLLFEALLWKMAATPDDYKTEPEAVRDELVKWMTDAQLTAVEVMMSGYDFSAEAQNECRARSIHVTKLHTTQGTFDRTF